MSITYDDCVRVLENWGDWSREGRIKLGHKRRSNFYDVGGGALVLDEDLANLAECAMVSMMQTAEHNKQYVTILRLKYYSRMTDRQIVHKMGRTLRQVQICKECAHQLFYDYLCRMSAQQ